MTQLAHDSVAHRSLQRKDDGEVVTHDDVETLLDDVGAIVHAWTALLDNVGLSLDPPRIGKTRAAVTALRLFDWREWVEAQSHAESKIGPGAPPEVYDQVRESGRFEYVFDVPEQTWPREERA